MASVQVTAPTKYTGDRCGVHFRDGHAVADSERDAAALAYFRRRGYTVVEPEPEPDEGDGDSGEAEGDGSGESLPEIPDRPAARDSKETWAAYAQAVGIDTEGMSKPEIVDAVERHHADDDDDLGTDGGEG